MGVHMLSQVAVFHRGRCVVDVAAGCLGPADPRAVSSDSLFCLYDIRLSLAALAVHRLAAAGSLAYDDPVSSLWPAFGQAGVTVRDLLAHRTGLQHCVSLHAPVCGLQAAPWAALGC